MTLTLSPRVTNESLRKPDRVAGALAGGFVVLLLATELILTLPDEADSPVFVADFYAAHRSFIITLQVLGLVAAALLGAYAWRLRSIDRLVAAAGMIMAVCALVPGLITLVIAIVADPNHPAAAGVWNALEPRGDDVLFVGIVVFAGTIALRLGRRLPALGVLAGLVAVSCLARLVLEAAGRRRGPLEAVGPLLFVILIAVMAVSSFLGILRPGLIDKSEG
ncbi:MAG TPA: hypothetical protein VF241_05535 [Propionibacteriaceae bacterium]